MSTDVALHHAKVTQLVSVAHGLQGLIHCGALEGSYEEHLAAILQLQDEVNTNLGRLLSFREAWTAYELLTDKLDNWIRSVRIDPEGMLTPGNMRQFWVIISVLLIVSEHYSPEVIYFILFRF